MLINMTFTFFTRNHQQICRGQKMIYFLKVYDYTMGFKGVLKNFPMPILLKAFGP